MVQKYGENNNNNYYYFFKFLMRIFIPFNISDIYIYIYSTHCSTHYYKRIIIHGDIQI